MRFRGWSRRLRRLRESIMGRRGRGQGRGLVVVVVVVVTVEEVMVKRGGMVKG